MGSYAENQQITAVRKVFQRGVVNPMINIEGLWKDYCQYEQVTTFIFLIWSVNDCLQEYVRLFISSLVEASQDSYELEQPDIFQRQPVTNVISVVLLCQVSSYDFGH